MAHLRIYTLLAFLVASAFYPLFASSEEALPEDTALALVAASKGLGAATLCEAEALPLDEHLALLQKTPRDERWVYEVLGSDTALDTYLLTYQMRSLLGRDRARAEDLLLQMALSSDPDAKRRVATFLWTQTQDPLFGTCPRYKTLSIIDSSALMRQVQHMKGLVTPSGVTTHPLTPKL